MDHHAHTAMRSPHEVMGHGGDAGMSMDAMVLDMCNRFLVAAVLSVPILLWSAIGRQVLHVGVPAPFGLREDAFQLILSLPVIGYSSWIFFDGAVRASGWSCRDQLKREAACPPPDKNTPPTITNPEPRELRTYAPPLAL